MSYPTSAPTRSTKTATTTQLEAGGGDRVCHLLDDQMEPLCGKRVRRGGLLRKSHLIPGAKTRESPCPACGRPRCSDCAAVIA